jgi:hypothetical protein
LSAWDSVGGKLSVALRQRFENADKVEQVCQSIRTTNMDPHVLFAQVGERLGLVPATAVAAAFANIWAQAYPELVQQTLPPFLSYLPMEKAEVVA